MSDYKLKRRVFLFQRLMNWIERFCNQLPLPGILFLFLFAITAVFSYVLNLAKIAVTHPLTGVKLPIQNFFSTAGLYWFLEHMISNFVLFPPLGIVLVMSIAVGFCEESGLIETILWLRIKNISKRFLPYIVAFIGILGNIASDTAAIVFPPIAGLIYLASDKHPIAGMLCGYVSVQAGFSANLVISGIDGLLQSITQSVVDNFMGTGKVTIDITCNWFFMIASTFLCTLVIGFFCDKLADKRFGKYIPPRNFSIQNKKVITKRDKKALFWSVIAITIFLVVIILATIWGPLGILVGHEKSGDRGFIGSYMLKYLVTIIVFLFTIPGIVYGQISGNIKGLNGIYQSTSKILGNMGEYLAFCFFCAQFQQLFSWTRIDILLATGGAKILRSTGFTDFRLIIIFILLSSFINIFITSASSKWTIMAPVFIPMMIMCNNYHPAMTQLFYRIGDSATNAFTPVMSYLWIMLKNAQDKYDPNIKIGTLTSVLFPISIILLFFWIIFLGLWLLLGLPIGPGVTNFIVS